MRVRARPQIGVCLPGRPTSVLARVSRTVGCVEDWRLRVLLVRSVGTLDDTFEYSGVRLPEVGDEIELRSGAESVVRARVTGVEPLKSLPIRANEV